MQQPLKVVVLGQHPQRHGPVLVLGDAFIRFDSSQPALGLAEEVECAVFK